MTKKNKEVEKEIAPNDGAGGSIGSFFPKGRKTNVVLIITIVIIAGVVAALLFG